MGGKNLEGFCLSPNQYSHQDFIAKGHIRFGFTHNHTPLLKYHSFPKGTLASMALAKGHMSRSKGYCTLWKTLSENTAWS